MIVSITISMIIMMVSNNNAIMISPYRLGTSLHRGPFTKWGIATSGMSTIVTNIIIIVITKTVCLFQMEQTVWLSALYKFHVWPFSITFYLSKVAFLFGRLFLRLNCFIHAKGSAFEIPEHFPHFCDIKWSGRRHSWSEFLGDIIICFLPSPLISCSLVEVLL